VVVIMLCFLTLMWAEVVRFVASNNQSAARRQIGIINRSKIVNHKTHSPRAVKAVTTLMAVILTAFASSPSAQNYTGNGGKGISLTIYVPQSTGLASDRSYIPALVQGEFVSNFSNYSAISILDWERLDDIYVKLLSEAYDDNAAAKQDIALGRLAPTSHFLTGSVTQTAAGYNIKMSVTSTSDKMTVAAYSGTFSFAELDNLTGIRRASLELLQKLGVELTEKARRELAGAAEASQVSARTALAKGVTAQRAGTEVAALSYYYQAASINPALDEAVKRSSVVAANISSGNVGADVRNDIQWRKNWVARLKETEVANYEMIARIMAGAADPPYTLAYFTDIKTVGVNYQAETADLGIKMKLTVNRAWFVAAEQTLSAAAQAVKTVLDGLNAANRKNEWGLAKWPRDGVSGVNPFISDTKKQYDITAVFELVNQQGRVIGSQTIKQNPGITIKSNKEGGFTIAATGGGVSTVTFKGVRADDISDNLTIRVASVNAMPPQQARFTISAMPFVEKTPPFTDARDGKRYNTVKIGGMTWMAENLSYRPQTGNVWCYGNNSSNCDKYGLLYDGNVAMRVCPYGWHLPSRQEWGYLVDLIGEKEAAKKLKSTSDDWQKDKGTDDYGFSALPGGYRHQYDGFGGIKAVWWTSTESGKYFNYYRYLSGTRFGEETATKQEGQSVRCLQD